MDEYEILEDSMSLEQTHGVEIISQNFPVAVGSQKQSIRGKGFTMVEDEALCRAYLAISQDPIIGINQTMANLWERIRLCFSSQADVDCNRTAVSLMKRWSKIQKAVSKFCGFLAQVERRQKSGTGEKEKMAEAKRMFSIDERNKSFMFESCWEILRHSCKWDKIMTPSQKPTVQTTTSSNPSTGTPISLESELDLDQQPSREGVNRPSGIKAALESRRKKVIDDVKFDQMATNQSQIINVLAGISSRGIEREQQKAADRQKKAEDREARRHYLAEKNEREQRKEDHIIMSMDMSNLTPMQRAYYEQRQQQIIARTGML
ncbi:hypothetical protein RHGRI_011519 [Rhododendron griersonianum]|uniref:No apical meristem-associated C-terminal domain-containing protein n=1 Tax=Rhododendron griersonianum TaxID=479676 RepID=A0AAV6KN04_9ERIC|nr:hypothetical protein RHGRI_011519 [Rhododendron griersonianum]